MRVAVVGAGVMGLSTARSLLAAGDQVTVYEPRPIFHTEGSSHGRSRIVRVAYIDPFYAEIMKATMPKWREWQSLSSVPILHEVGIVYLGPAASPDMQSVKDTLRGLGEPTTEISREHESGLILSGDEVGIYSADGGWVDADAVRRFLWSGIEESVTLANVQVQNPSELQAQFDRVVLTVGSWATQFCNWSVRPRLQTVAYFEGHHPGPVWIDAFGDMMYGFPSEPGRNDFKVGIHNFGKDFDPDVRDRPTDTESLSRLTDYVKERFGIVNPTITHSVTCLYTMTDDEDFRIGWLDRRILLVSPCSGHGFKFAPYLGDLVQGVLHEDVPIPLRFTRQD